MVITEYSALNEKVYGKLMEVMPAHQLHAMYTLCLSDGRKRATRMREFVSAGDEGGYIREAHALKGGCGMLGATELYELASTMEKTGLQSGSGESSVEQIGPACERLERILKARA